MKGFTWFLLFLLALIGAIGYYVYRYIFIPERVLLVRLNEENLKLKYEIQDRLNEVYREMKERSATEEDEKEDTLKTDGGDVTSSNQVNAFKHFSVSFSIKDLFVRNQLSTRGKALIREFYSQIQNKEFDSIRIVINRKNTRAARKVLSIKQYLVSLGLQKDRVWARLSNEIPKDSIRVNILW